MTSSQGTEYYLKSMNGIKAFDDGSGTIIEDDAITIATVNATDIYCENFSNTGTFFTTAFSANSIETSSITSALGNLTVNGDITTSATINAGFLEVENNVYCENITARTGMYTNTIEPTITNIDINLFTTTTGTVKIGTAKKISLGNIIADDSLVITNGNIGTLKTAIIQPPSLISQIEFYKDTTLPLYFAKFKFQNNAITSGAVNDTVSLFNNITTGIVQMCNNLVFTQNAIRSSGASDTIDLFNNITTTTGSINIANGSLSKCILNLGSKMHSTGQVNIGGFGTVKMCNSFIITAESIASTGILDTIQLFTNITTGISNFLTGLTSGTLNIGNTTATTGNGGNINIGTGTKCDINIGNGTNNSTANYNGCCTINKLQVGVGTGFRCVMMGRNVGAGTESGTITITGAPTGFGNPLVFASINVISSNMYMVMVNPNGVNTFQYQKRFYNGSGINGATAEGFNYVAIWL